MAIQKEAKRVDTGRSLTDMHNQAISAIAVLEGINTNLTNLKSNMGTDVDYAIADTDEVQAVITNIKTRIAAIKE